MFGVEITFLDGSKDWIDPVTLEPQEIDGVLWVHNSSNAYDYNIADIKKWAKYSLCKICEHDMRSYDCTDKECNK